MRKYGSNEKKIVKSKKIFNNSETQRIISPLLGGMQHHRDPSNGKKKINHNSHTSCTM